MINAGNYTIETYAHIINVDKTILKLNPIIEKFGYKFLCADATEIELNFSELLNVHKDDKRPHTIMIGRKPHDISHELANAIFHNPIFGQRFIHSEFPEIVLLKKVENFEITGDEMDFIKEGTFFKTFRAFTLDLLLQLRLFKRGEIRCNQYFQITSTTRQISSRRVEISIGSSGSYTLDDNEIDVLHNILREKFESNSFTELAVRNFTTVYDIPDGQIRYITLMTCLESLFNLGKDQIAHTIARHLSIILSENKEQFLERYTRIKKLYNKRNLIVHGGEYKGELIEDYLELSEIVRRAINYCNQPGITKEKLFEDLNIKGF